MRIDPSRRGGIDETRGKLWEYRKNQKWPPSWKNLEKRQKRILPYFLYMGSAAWAEPLLLNQNWVPKTHFI